MQAFVGDPPRGRWEHPALRGVFIRTLGDRGLPIETCRQLRKQLRYLLDAREVADYREDEIEAALASEALEIARDVLRLAEEPSSMKPEVYAALKTFEKRLHAVFPGASLRLIDPFGGHDIGVELHLSVAQITREERKKIAELAAAIEEEFDVYIGTVIKPGTYSNARK